MLHCCNFAMLLIIGKIEYLHNMLLHLASVSKLQLPLIHKTRAIGTLSISHDNTPSTFWRQKEARHSGHKNEDKGQIFL